MFPWPGLRMRPPSDRQWRLLGGLLGGLWYALAGACILVGVLGFPASVLAWAAGDVTLAEAAAAVVAALVLAGTGAGLVFLWRRSVRHFFF